MVMRTAAVVAALLLACDASHGGIGEGQGGLGGSGGEMAASAGGTLPAGAGGVETMTGGAPAGGAGGTASPGAGGAKASGGSGGSPGGTGDMVGSPCASDPRFACMGGTQLYLWACLGTDCLLAPPGSMAEACSGTDRPHPEFPYPERAATICIDQGGAPGGGLISRRWANLGYPCRTDSDCGPRQPAGKPRTCHARTRTCAP
jgi:hypothetical protein